jgi:hypothetical protein
MDKRIAPTRQCAAMRSWTALTAGCVAILLCASAARAGLPQRALVGNFVGYDAFPENYLSISGSVDRTQNGESLYLEKTISPDSSFSLFAGYQRLEQEGDTTTGFSNLSLAYKHVLISIPRHEFMLSLAPEAELPVGNRSIGSESHARAGFDLIFAKGLGDLADSIALLRPAALEGDIGWETKVTGARDDLVAATAEIEYSLAYLDENVARFSITHALRNLTPHLDFDYAQYMDAHRNSTAPDFELTPGIAWLNSTYEINLGVQVALNHASSTTGAVAFVWLLGVSFDQIVPALAWTPFR